jgi:anti-sigma B factor antagonist
MIIAERTEADVSILALKGKITLGEGDELLRQRIGELLGAGRRKIVLDLAEVTYIDSAGIGELVRTYTTVKRQGGKLWLCNPTKRISDLLTITKLLTVFEVGDTVEQAVRALRGDSSLEVQCPLVDCDGWILVPSAELTELTCHGCGAELTAALSESPGTASRVTRIRLPTYEGERVTLTAGRPTVIAVNGRLDLFAGEMLERAWRTVPPPRRISLDVTEATEISDAGMALLAELCARRDEESRTIVVGRGSEPAAPSELPGDGSAELVLTVRRPT